MLYATVNTTSVTATVCICHETRQKQNAFTLLEKIEKPMLTVGWLCFGRLFQPHYKSVLHRMGERLSISAEVLCECITNVCFERPGFECFSPSIKFHARVKNQGLLCGCDPPRSSLLWLSGSWVWPGALRLWSKSGGEKEGARRSREQHPCHCLAPSEVMPSWGWETFASVVLLWAVNKNILQMSDARLRNQKGIVLSVFVCSMVYGMRSCIGKGRAVRMQECAWGVLSRPGRTGAWATILWRLGRWPAPGSLTVNI